MVQHHPRPDMVSVEQQSDDWFDLDSHWTGTLAGNAAGPTVICGRDAAKYNPVLGGKIFSERKRYRLGGLAFRIGLKSAAGRQRTGDSLLTTGRSVLHERGKMSDQELEIKFFLIHPEQFTQKLKELQAELVSRRTNEWNLRFDTSTNSLAAEGKALRLRKDHRTRLTFKGPSQQRTDITARQELEVSVSDFQTTRQILEALGFQVAVIYEKFRTTWHLDGTEVVFDELPIGTFCEIEGQNADQIRAVAESLGLDWERRLATSYLSIFAQLKDTLGWPPINLTYKEMAGIPVNQHDLEWINIHPGDEAVN